MPCQTKKDHHSVKIKECFATRFARRMNDAKVDNFSSEIWRGIQNHCGRRSQPFCEAVQRFLGGAHRLLLIKIEHHRRWCIAKSKQKYWFPSVDYATMRCPCAHAFSTKMTNLRTDWPIHKCSLIVLIVKVSPWLRITTTATTHNNTYHPVDEEKSKAAVPAASGNGKLNLSLIAPFSKYPSTFV